MVVEDALVEFYLSRNVSAKAGFEFLPFVGTHGEGGLVMRSATKVPRRGVKCRFGFQSRDSMLVIDANFTANTWEVTSMKHAKISRFVVFTSLQVIQNISSVL